MKHNRLLLLSCLAVAALPGTALTCRVSAQTGSDPLAGIPKLLDVLDRDGFEVRQGRIGTPDMVAMVCSGGSPAAWYNNAQRYMTAVLPPMGEEIGRMVEPNYLMRQDDALLLVGTTPPPLAYFSFQTFLYGRRNPKVANYDPALGGAFQKIGYELLWTYLGDTVNSLTLRTTASSPFNAPMVLVSTGHRQTQERVLAALAAAGYSPSMINTETLPPSILRFGDKDGDQFLHLIRTAIPAESAEAMTDYLARVVDLQRSPLRVYRVRPKTPLAADPLPAPVLRTRGTGHTEIDLTPAMQKLRAGILEEYASRGYEATELDTSALLAEGYPSMQRDLAWIGPAQEGSLGASRDANYLGSAWFDLADDAIAVVYGVNHAATGKATYSSAVVYLDENLEVGVAGTDSTAFPHTADRYLIGEPNADRFYMWQVRRDCTGAANCMEAKSPCQKVGAKARVRVGFRAYAEPATKTGPSDVELLYDRVIVFRPIARHRPGGR